MSLELYQGCWKTPNKGLFHNIETLRIEKTETEFWEYFANLKNSTEYVGT